MSLRDLVRAISIRPAAGLTWERGIQTLDSQPSRSSPPLPMANKMANKP